MFFAVQDSSLFRPGMSVSVSPELESCRAASLRLALSYRAALHDDATVHTICRTTEYLLKRRGTGFEAQIEADGEEGRNGQQTHSLPRPLQLCTLLKSLDSSSRTRPSPFPSLHESNATPLHRRFSGNRASEREREKALMATHSPASSFSATATYSHVMRMSQ
ncbi:hypothetical protein J3F84DRAFT_245537 [Trichoderma pleuroticola]